jgi:hypothetical protein
LVGEAAYCHETPVSPDIISLSESTRKLTGQSTGGVSPERT